MVFHVKRRDPCESEAELWVPPASPPSGGVAERPSGSVDDELLSPSTVSGSAGVMDPSASSGNDADGVPSTGSGSDGVADSSTSSGNEGVTDSSTGSGNEVGSTVRGPRERWGCGPFDRLRERAPRGAFDQLREPSSQRALPRRRATPIRQLL